MAKCRRYVGFFRTLANCRTGCHNIGAYNLYPSKIHPFRLSRVNVKKWLLKWPGVCNCPPQFFCGIKRGCVIMAHLGRRPRASGSVIDLSQLPSPSPSGSYHLNHSDSTLSIRMPKRRWSNFDTTPRLTVCIGGPAWSCKSESR